MTTKLFCFPFAGGSASFFVKWKKILPPGIELVPVEYPGHGKRIASPLCESVSALVDDLYPRILAECSGAPFAFFGHSLGVLVAYELASRMQERRAALPAVLFLSCNNAPRYPGANRHIYNLSDDEIIKKMVGYGGTSPEVFETAELREFFLPILKADLKAADLFSVEAARPALDTSLAILCARDDPLLTEEGITAWNSETNRDCRIEGFVGGHMYLAEQGGEVCAFIGRRLAELA